MCPTVSLDRSAPLLAEVGVLLCFLPSSLTWVSFPRDGVGWEGAGQGRAWHLGVSFPDKVRAWLEREPGATAITFMSSPPEVARVVSVW